VDAYRENAPLIAGGFHLVQVVALGMLLLGLIALARMPKEQMDPSS
jgi:hypothetical protein